MESNETQGSAEVSLSNPDFFLVYAPHDEHVATKLYELLSSHHKVFFAPKCLLLGDDEPVIVDHALRAARVILILISPRCGADYFRREQVAYALNFVQSNPDAQRVVPLYLDGAVPERNALYGVMQKVSLVLPAIEYLRQAATQLADLLARLRGQASSSPVIIDDPFRKLREFTLADQDIFYGRDVDVRDLADEVQYRLVVLHGASGTGKTSLLQAGLRPTIQREFVWFEVSLQQDSDPVDLIMDQVKQHLALRNEPEPPENPIVGLLNLARVEGRRVLLVLDHAEKLFQGQPQACIQERCQRLAAIILLLEEQTPAVHVLLSLRDDFHGQLRFLHKAGLHSIFDHGHLLRPLEVSAARRALTEPLLRAGYVISPKLTVRIIEDLCGPERAVNPVELQIIGDTLYERASKLGLNPISRNLYENLGGVGQVLALYLTEKLKEFSSDQQRGVEEILCALIAPGGERTPAMTAEALAVRANLDESRTMDLIRRLINPLRLVRADEQAGKPVYRLAHDQVAKAMFERLEEDKREDIKTRSELQPRIAEWKKTPLPRLNLALLSPEQRLGYLKWYERNPERATPDERQFLATLRQVEMGKRVLLLVMALLIPLGAGTAVWRVKVAERLRIEAQAREAEAKAEQMLERDPGQSLAWIEEAARLHGGIQQEDSNHFQSQWLMAVDAYHKSISWIVAQHKREISNLAFSPKELKPGNCRKCWPHKKLLATAGQDGDIYILDIEKGGKSEQIYHNPQGGHSYIAFAPNGEHIVICNSAGELLIVDVESRRHVWDAPASHKMNTCTGVSYSQTGKYLAAADSATGSIDVYRMTNNNAPEFEFQHEGFGKITQFAFSPKHEKLIAVIGDKAYLQSLRGIRMTLTTIYPNTKREVDGSYHAMSFSPDGKMLALAKSGVLIVWRFNGFHEILGIPTVTNELVQVSQTGGATIFSMDWAPTSSGLLLGDQLGQVTQWGSTDKEILRKANHTTNVNVVKYSNNLEWILSGDEDGKMKLTDSGAAHSRTLFGHDSEVLVAQFSPDDQFVASADASGTVRLWMTRRGNVQVNIVNESLNQNLLRLILDSSSASAITIADHGETFRWLSPHEAPIPIKSYVGAPIFAACQPSNTSLLTGMFESDGLLQYIDLNSNKLISTTKTGAPISSLSCNKSTGSHYLVGHVNGQVEQRKIDKEDPKVIAKVDFPIRHLLTRKNDASIVIASFNNIKILNEDGTLIDMPPIPNPCSRALDMQVSTACEKCLLIGCSNGHVLRLDTTIKQYTELAPRHNAEILRLALMTQVGILASASNGPIKLTWEGANYSRQLFGHRGAVTDISFSDDRRFLVSIGLDGTLRRWPLPPSHPAEFEHWMRQTRTYRIESGMAVPQDIPPLAAMSPSEPGPK